VALRVVDRYVPRIVAEVPCTALVVTLKVTLFAPAGMVADEGTCATDVLVLLSETTAPAGGALPLSVKVAMEDEPPVTVVGLRTREVREATETVRVVVLVTP